jgi:nicotinamide-nucleotide amidase
MRGEIITIGEELLCGRVLNLNAWYASCRLSAMGFHVTAIATVGDRAEDVRRVVELALDRSDFLIVTGGLGTTDDDITTKTVAELFGRPLTLDRFLLDHIRQEVQKQDLLWNDDLEKLAWLPKGARLMDPEPKACGYYLEEKGHPVFFLPGVPEEMRLLLDKFIIPHLQALQSGKTYYATRTLKLFGIREDKVGTLLKGLGRDVPDLIIGYYPNFPEVHVVFTARGEDSALLDSIVADAEKAAEEKIGPYIVARDEETLEQTVGKLLLNHKMNLAVAESCTGGLICHRLTEVSGSSEYFERGFIVYSDRSKMEELGVPMEVLTNHGAVSAPTAEAMAQGVCRVSDTSLGLSATGIAGPTGGTPDKPVGTVYIGMATARGVVSKGYRFFGNRSQVKQMSASMALDWIRRFLTGDSFFHRL